LSRKTLNLGILAHTDAGKIRHPDFIAEVERVLNVLGGAVLVISAVEGLQPQTLVLMRALQCLLVPTVVFVNRVGRMGAGYDRILEAIASDRPAGSYQWDPRDRQPGGPVRSP